MSRLLRFASLALALGGVAAGSACRFGEAHFTASFDGEDAVFDPGGTVFAYLDAKDADLVEDRDPRVVVAMTWVVFDPQSDLNDLDGASLSALAHEASVRDALTLVFDHQGDVDEGASFAHDNTSSDNSGLVVTPYFAPERLTADSSFAGLRPLASRRVSDVDVDAANFDDASGAVAGTLKLELSAVSGTDAGNAREGSVEGSFRAPLVDERVAEHNLALLRDLGATSGTVPLPLPLEARE